MLIRRTRSSKSVRARVVMLGLLALAASAASAEPARETSDPQQAEVLPSEPGTEASHYCYPVCSTVCSIWGCYPQCYWYCV